ncbi:biotin-dependent carboxyltransferase family protein [Reyranella sp.]|uniref:5-oxoprolinase subunit C family protein n=1 Tax=Reyranella sp. TaxID=1929291 RepID=UPI003BACC924
MSGHLKVVRAGLFDTLQDLGRTGFMALGMPTAGAMDRIGLRLANAMCGNPAGMAGLEIGVMGPDLLVEAESVRIALAGPLSASLVEAPDAAPKPLESDRTHLLKRGQVLRVGMVEGSSTAYLAVAGGFALAPFMGSLSTYARAGVGGLKGRKLAADDVLPLVQEAAPPGDEKKLARPFDYGSGPVRIVWGPQDDYFSARGRKTFIESEYRVSKEADRMGIRFEGPTIEHATPVDKGGADIISDGIAPGAIQVPGAGLPIVLLADRQTVGGYPKIATVASVDLPRLGRLLPGNAVTFTSVTVEEAEALRRDQEARLARAIAELQTARPPGGIDLVRLYEENLIDGIVYEREALPG